MERLAEASLGTEASILDAALGARLDSRATLPRSPGAVVRTRDLFCSSAAPRRCARLAHRLGPRQIERPFNESVGFGPKTLCRLARFQRVVRAVEPSSRPGWARLAAQHGYADQSHLAREFREFAGTTLSDYVRELHPMSDHFHNVAVTDESNIE